MQILVVEDEKRLAAALEHILTQQKYMVDLAYDGTDGYDLAESGIYDIIILDVMLPGMNGYEVASRLRKEKIATVYELDEGNARGIPKIKSGTART